MSSELKELSEFYANRVSSKESEIKKLRAYIEELESSGKKLSAEYAGQIAEKSRQVKQLTELLSARENFSENTLKNLNSKVVTQRDYLKSISSSLGKKEQVTKEAIDKLAEQLREKNRELEKLRVTLVSQQRIEKHLDKKASEKIAAADYGKGLGNEKELDRLRSYVIELENSGKRLSAEYAEQLSEKDRQIRQLVNMLKLREDSNRLLSEKLDSKTRTERDYVERLKGAISRREEFNHDIIEKLTADLSRKNEEVDRLRDAAIRQEKLVKRFESEVAEYRKRQESLEAFLHEKDSMKQKLEKNFAQQLRNKEYEIEQLGSDLRKQFDSKPAARNTEEISALKVKLGAREAELNGVLLEFTNLKEQNRIAMKRLDERQNLFVESEKTYNQLINSLQLQQEKRVKELMSANSQREVELRTELEKLKAGQREKETILAEKESRIDETLLQFSETSRKLLELKESEKSPDADRTLVGLKDKEAYLLRKEAELGKLLKEADDRIKEAIKKEHEIERREDLLVKEQEAINSELSILKNAGVEIKKDKEYLKEKIRRYETPEKETQLEQPALVGDETMPEEAPVAYESEIQPENAEITEASPVQEAVEEVKGKAETLEILRRPGKAEVIEEESLPMLTAEPEAKEKKGVKKLLFKQAKSRVKPLPRPPLRSIKAKAERPKIREALMRQAEKKDSFPEVDGYGEIQEIESIISIGLQHGDSVEQIKNSLADSGYSKQTIEKAFRQVKKN